MGDLVYLKNEEAFTDSISIAIGTGSTHHAIQQLITKYESDFATFGKVAFEMRPLESGQHTKIYMLNEEQATLLLTYMKNTEKIREFKKKLVTGFYKMRCLLLEKSTNEWLETRKTGQITRKAETDVIKNLVEYAKNQGSEHAEMLYMTYSRLANKMAGITARDTATVIQLNHLTFIENIILNQVRIGMERGMHYKDIYQDCKKQIELFKAIAYLDSGIQINEVEQCTILQALPKMTNSL